MNPIEGRMMWSDTGCFEKDSMGDRVKVMLVLLWYQLGLLNAGTEDVDAFH